MSDAVFPFSAVLGQDELKRCLALCAVDPEPRALNTPAITGMFKLFAEMIAFHIDAHERVATSQADLFKEREASGLREQFVAVLGHDLRNPLASIDACMSMPFSRSLTLGGRAWPAAGLLVPASANVASTDARCSGACATARGQVRIAEGAASASAAAPSSSPASSS